MVPPPAYSGSRSTESSDSGSGRAGERGTLDAARIVDAAITFIDDNGIRALTMRRLGSTLGVEAMALYRYLPSRDAVLDAVVERVVGELYDDPDVQLTATESWQHYLQQMAHGIRRLALAHPQVFPLISTRPPAAPWVRPPLRSLRLAESFLSSLCDSGFSDDGAVAAYRGFTSFLIGHLLLEVSALGADVGPVEEADPREGTSEDLREFPSLMRLEAKLSDDRSTEEFEESLESLLDRLETLLN